MTSQLIKGKDSGILTIHPESFNFAAVALLLEIKQTQHQNGRKAQYLGKGQRVAGLQAEEEATPASTLGSHSHYLNILTIKLPPSLESSLLQALAILCCT